MKNNKWIAHINHVFPFTRQTFTYREVAALRDEGLAVKTFSMKKPDASVLSGESIEFCESTVYIPSVLSACAILINLRVFCKSPVKFISWLCKIVFSPYSIHKGWREILQSLCQFIRAGMLARKINDCGGIPHLHAQFADGAATTALIAADYLGTTFSFYSHTSSNVQFLGEKIKEAKFIFSISDFDKKKLLEVQPGAFDKIHIVHCGIPLENWEYSDINRKSDMIISVGGLDEFKGHHVLIDACKILKENGRPFECKIIGEGQYRQILERKIAEYSLENSVVLAGSMPQEEIRPLLKKAGIFVLASVKAESGNMDGIPVALMEAMASGVPVISTRLSGISELVDDGKDGFLVESGNAEELAGKIMYLMDNYEQVRSLCPDAQKKIEESFSLKVQGCRMAEIFKSLS